MAKLASFVLAVAQLTSVHGLPAGDNKREPGVLDDRAITLTSNIRATTSFSTAIETLQSISVTVEPSLTGSIRTALPSRGVFTQDPIVGPGATLASEPLRPNPTPLDPGPTAPLGYAANNIFQPLEAGRFPPSIPSRDDHIVRKNNIVDGDVPIQTNKFYANFFLGSQGFPVWTNPYSLTWAKGVGSTYGMSVTHTIRDQFAFGPNPESPQYFISPVGIHHVVLSAAELQEDTHLSVESLKAFSVYANLAASAGSRVLMSIPCVQGMGFVTALYDQAQPVINTGVFFRTLNYVELVNGVTHKYRLTLNDGSVWLLYATSIGSVGVPPFTLTDTSTITGPQGFSGMIQVTKNPSGWEGEAAMDASAGAYAINATITGSTRGSAGSYSLSWAKGGVQSQTLLMYALPHHVESFDQETRAALQNLTLVTTTKGYARAVLADHITMIEGSLPDNIGFAPWAKAPNGAAGGSENIHLAPGALTLINQAGIAELGQDFDSQTRLNSMYYSGKGLAKFAAIIYTLEGMTGKSQYAAAGLVKLKDAFNVFVNNTQPEPLVYDYVWKGVVSSATYRAPFDTGLDFGNTLYNDHHFHYGYFVWTAAVIGHLDPTWLDQGINKAWVNTLVRDYANPVDDDVFPFQRSFDWYHGHSWAKGLFESGDGKDQESTSEDTFATYALKMWGKISRDPNMEARGNLQLAVQARSLKNYFLMTSDNQNQPPQFLPNKVTGILFENKIDHTTYFGTNTEYIEGIHMIPLNPSSAYTRSKRFVQEEWDTYFSNGRVDQVNGGWKAILYANLALVDPQRSYDFFADPDFNTTLDGGASRTWYLAYSAAMLGAEQGYAVPDESMVDDESQVAQPDEEQVDDSSQDEEPENTEPEDPEPQYDEPVYTEPEYTDYDGPRYTESQYSQPEYSQPEYTEPHYSPPGYTYPQYSEPEYTEAGHKYPQNTKPEYTESRYRYPQDAAPTYAESEYTDSAETGALRLATPDLAPQETHPTSSTKGKWPVGFDWPQSSHGPRPTPKPKSSYVPTPKPTPVYEPAEEQSDDGERPPVYELLPYKEGEAQFNGGESSPVYESPWYEESEAQYNDDESSEAPYNNSEQPPAYDVPPYEESEAQYNNGEQPPVYELPPYEDSEAPYEDRPQSYEDDTTYSEDPDVSWALQDKQDQDDRPYNDPDHQSPPRQGNNDNNDEAEWEEDMDCDDGVFNSDNGVFESSPDEDIPDDFTDAGEDAGRFLDEQW